MGWFTGLFRDQGTVDALDRMARDGSDMTRPMRIDFCVAVPSEQAGHAVGHRAAALGYEISVDRDADDGVWTCSCSVWVVASYDNVTRIEQQLDALGREHGGHIDGFGSFGNGDVDQPPGN